MLNPYVSRGPVRNPEMFFGRKHEINEIVAFLRGNQSVSIVGPRKIGKTSLLFHLMRRTVWQQYNLGDQNLFVYIDCEVLGDLDHTEIFRQFAAEMEAALDEYGFDAEPELTRAIETPSRLSWERAIRKLNQRGLRVVLILDEFERLSLNASLDVNFFNALRSAAGRYQLAYITASAHPLIELTYSGRSQEILSSPFFNIFALRSLGFLEETEAFALIREPAQAAGFTIPVETEKLIYQTVGRYPLGLQIACFHTLENPNSPWEDIEPKITQELNAHFQYAWNNLSISEQHTLRHISDADIRSQADTTLRGMLRDLVQKCLLAYENGRYHYPSRIWEKFVSNQQTTQPPTPASKITTGMLSGLTGSQIGPYEILGQIARGGMSEVYRGRHTRLERIVAIKILPISLASEQDFRERFTREAQGVATLQHPNIVQVYDFGDLQNTYYMVMEFINGRDLGSLMRATGALSLKGSLNILKQIATALDYAHARGVVHRDIKPSNVMVENEPIPGTAYARAVLTDFGIAKLRSGDTGATKTGMLMGTLNYMAPEQIRSSGQVDGRADVYALGVMTYQLLTGKLPFEAENPGALMLAHLQATAPDPRLLQPDLPAHTALGLLRAMEKDPSLRPATAGEFISLLT